MFFGISPSTRGGNRTRTPLPELDFESSASTNSATRANFLCGKLVRKSNYFKRIPKDLPKKISFQQKNTPLPDYKEVFSILINNHF